MAEPALALTGVNEGEDLVWILIQSGISAFLYFLVAPVSENELIFIYIIHTKKC